MEHIDSNYAAFLHTQDINPYSMYTQNVDGSQFVWVINLLNNTMYSQIASSLLNDGFFEFSLRALRIQVEVIDKKVLKFDTKNFAEIFYQNRQSNSIACQFLTPVSFKQNGKYARMLDIQLVFQNLMMKYSAICEVQKGVDENLLEELVARTEVVQYKLASSYFKIGGAKIPGFIGNVKFQVGASRTLANYAAMMLKFGSFSGCGIKTAMGMGAMRLIEEECGKSSS
jgi:CRISPR-associated endoribonuclease Cas6